MVKNLRIIRPNRIEFDQDENHIVLNVKRILYSGDVEDSGNWLYTYYGVELENSLKLKITIECCSYSIEVL